MTYLVTSTDRRRTAVTLAAAEIAQIAHQAQEFDAAFGETLDSLPLGALIQLSERPRAA